MYLACLTPIISISIFIYQPSLADLYEYVMFGRIFKIEHRDNQGVDVLASFGGLLMKLSGEQSQLDSLKADSRYVYVSIS
jgi:DNA-directed RNA polymerase I, II, and III subunit RPABC3